MSQRHRTPFGLRIDNAYRSATGTSRPNGSLNHKSNTGMIVGIVVAVVVVFIGALIAIFLWRRQQKKHGKTTTSPDDVDQPNVEVNPYYGDAVTNYNSSHFVPGYPEPAMAEVGPVGIAGGSPSLPSTDPRYSYSSLPSSSQAFLEAQRGDRKVDPAAASAHRTQLPILNAPGTSTPPTSSYGTSSTSPGPKQRDWFSVTNPEVFQPVPQDARRSVGSPPPPPGAAMSRPISMGGLVPSEANQMGRSNTVATSMDRHKTPPPQYTPGSRDGHPTS